MAVLNNLQLELLKLYSRGLSDDALLEVKSILAKYFAERASDGMDKVWDENGLTGSDMTAWVNEHNRIESRS